LLSGHVTVRDLQHWETILAATRALLHDHYGISHVTLQPESPESPEHFVCSDEPFEKVDFHERHNENEL
jgi:hypothetical protein